MSGPESELRSVIVWFETAERMLGEVLDVVPYETAHENMWSPRLVTVLLETCSQLDSLLKLEAKQSLQLSGTKLDIKDYFQHFGRVLSEKWAVFWGEAPERIKPFEQWRALPDYTRDSYTGHELAWWTAYNKVKHNRIENRRQAMLKHAVKAVGGLFLAILYCDACRKAVGSSGWLQSPGHNPTAALKDHLNPQPHRYVLAETKLFSYPAGWMKEPIPKHLLWAGPASDRFQSWFQEQSE
jgi:hypothetical protein